jgi:DNA modification methylase
MELHKISISKLNRATYNPRKKLTPSDPEYMSLRRSIEEFGLVDPLIVNQDMTLIGGHQRLTVLKALGFKDADCVVLDLDKNAEKALNVALNKIAGSWDLDLLKDILGSMDDFHLALTGFSVAELDSILKRPGEIIEDDFDADAAHAGIVEPTAKLGDIWSLGKHRLMCGDSTASEDVAQLMGGQLADMSCTDPLYNMNYEGAGNTPRKKKETTKILNDNLANDSFRQLLADVNINLFAFLKDGGSFYVFYKELGEGVFISTLAEAGLTFKQELIWVKSQLVLGGSKYQNIYEPCLFGCKGTSVKFWYAGRKERSVIESLEFMGEAELRATVKELLEDVPLDVIRVDKNRINDLHPTMKPIKLLAKFINNSSKEGDIVVDLFGGSGSTLMACEQLERICYMMELDPKYIDVIINRWETFTGEKAELISG